MKQIINSTEYLKNHEPYKPTREDIRKTKEVLDYFTSMNLDKKERDYIDHVHTMMQCYDYEVFVCEDTETIKAMFGFSLKSRI